MKLWIAGLIVAMANVVPAQLSDGAIMYTAQDRLVQVEGDVNGQPEGWGTPRAQDFGPFNRTLSWPFSQQLGTGTASQNSQLLPDRILIDETARFTGTGSFGILVGIMRSTARIDFVVDVPSAFTVIQSHSRVRDFPATIASASLVGPQGAVFQWTDTFGAPSTWPSGELAGVLPAGSYTLQVESRIGYVGLSGSENDIPIAASVHMLIPTPSAAGIGLILGLAVRSRRRSTCSDRILEESRS